MAAYLIIGIGNPDPEYQGTRHNIGVMMLDYLNKKFGTGDFSFDKKLNSQISKGQIEKVKVIFAKLGTYVNESGSAVAKLKNFYKVKPEQVVIIQDDLDIEFGRYKQSFDKNSGGHKGIESIMKSLKTKKFYRLRMGIAVSALDKARQKTDKQRDAFVKDFVLSKFTPKEQDTLKKTFKEATEQLLQILK